MNKKLIIFFVLIAATVLSCIGSRNIEGVFLNHAGTVAILIFLAWEIRKNILSLQSFILTSVFTLFHILGARYLYSFVPYNEWSIDYLGWDINSICGFTRNHYDRFVHLIFGIILFPPLVELFLWNKGSTRKQAIWFSWLILQSFSMGYELLEWLVSLIFSPEATENYNGQQGDVWDAQRHGARTPGINNNADIFFA